MGKFSGAILILGAAILLAGCGGAVTRQYETRRDAEKARIFGQWLPKFIPASAHEIVATTDAEVNTAEGEFYFDTRDCPAFIRHLRHVQPDWSGEFKQISDDYNLNGYLAFEYSTWKARWVFFIHPTEGHAYYRMW